VDACKTLVALFEANTKLKSPKCGESHKPWVWTPEFALELATYHFLPTLNKPVVKNYRYW
jgi:hypothetical protein